MADLFPAEISHDPGGKRLPLPKGVTATATYGGPDDCYRYWLAWTWDVRLPTLSAGLMNPSCAGHRWGDMTLAWLHRWAFSRGFGRLIVVNADAYRAKDQVRLAEVADPMGPDNMAAIQRAGREADLFVLGYGQPKVAAVRDHGPRMARILTAAGVPLHVWKLAKNGTPKHPLYLPGDTAHAVWGGPDA